MALPLYGQQPLQRCTGRLLGRRMRHRARCVLVFSRTTGFRHASIPDGIAAITQLGAARGFAVEATEDPTQFSDAESPALQRRSSS